MDKSLLNLNENIVYEPFWSREQLTKEECKELRDFIDTHLFKSVVGTPLEYVAIRLQNIATLRIRDLMLKVSYDTLAHIRQKYDVKVYPEMCALNRWHVTGFQEPHSDMYSNDESILMESGYLDRDPKKKSREWTSITFLNDDFSGGESYFVHSDGTETINKPEEGSSIVFQGVFHKHGVKKIRRTYRYTISTWYTTSHENQAPQLYEENLKLGELALRLKLQGVVFKEGQFDFDPLYHRHYDWREEEQTRLRLQKPEYEKKFISS